MATKRYVIPKVGMLVPNPETGGAVVPVNGCLVADGSYWRRRFADKDIWFASDALAESILKKPAEAGALIAAHLESVVAAKEKPAGETAVVDAEEKPAGETAVVDAEEKPAGETAADEVKPKNRSAK